MFTCTLKAFYLTETIIYLFKMPKEIMPIHLIMPARLHPANQATIGLSLPVCSKTQKYISEAQHAFST